MHEDARSRRRPGALLQWGLAIGILALCIVFFFQTRDPMIIVFGIIAAAITATVVWMLAGGGTKILVKCSACSVLNDEDAKYCKACAALL